MAVFFNNQPLPRFRNAVLTIGTFDGVHKGHQAILKDVDEQARKIDGESVLITFEPHPRKLIFPEQSLQLLTTLDQKIQLLLDTGIDHIVVVPFDHAFASLSAEAYISNFLVSRFHPSTIVIGYDHHFGHDRTGNLGLLKTAGEKYDFAVHEIEAQKIDEASVSSTKIRNFIKEGDVTSAASMLGRPYKLAGTVVSGAQIGRQLGYPTANIRPVDENQLIAANGVYAITATHAGESYKGMLNIGVRPTVSAEAQLHIEAHLFDFNKDIYDQLLEIGFVTRLRDEQKFSSLDALKAQLADDKVSAKKVLGEV